jgi:hypothetical protein
VIGFSLSSHQHPLNFNTHLLLVLLKQYSCKFL